MNKKLYLDEKYYLEVVEGKISTKIKIEKNNKNIYFICMNMNNIEKNEYKKILKKLLRDKNRLMRRKLQIGEESNENIKVGYIEKYDEKNANHIEFIKAIRAILFEKKYDRYNYIYDTVCDYLDSFFYGKNLCDFKDNQCGEKRGTSSMVGCCHHVKVKWLGPFNTKMVECEHLKEDHSCGAKCISCKLFTCDYLEKKGIKFRIKDILLLDTFFNPIQKYFIKFMVFTPKEKILKRLMSL